MSNWNNRSEMNVRQNIGNGKPFKHFSCSFENSLPSGNTVTHWEGGEKCRLTYPLLISDELEGDCPDISLEERGEGGMPKDGLLRTNALLGLSLFDSVIDDDRPDAYD